MSNQWGRQPMGKDSRTLVFGIIIIGIIGYLILPNFFKAINSSTDPAVPATSLNNVNQSSTYDPNALNSPSSSSQLFPSINNTMNNGSENNALTSGYWVLFVSNGTTRQLSVNAQDYAFLQELFQSDNKGTGAFTVFLVDQGQIHQYFVSKEAYSIISDMASIKERPSNVTPNASSNPTPDVSPNPAPDVSPNPTPNVSPNPTPNVSPNPAPNVSPNSTPNANSGLPGQRIRKHPNTIPSGQ